MQQHYKFTFLVSCDDGQFYLSVVSYNKHRVIFICAYQSFDRNLKIFFLHPLDFLNTLYYIVVGSFNNYLRSYKMELSVIYQLAKEYVADPNCRPELWVADQGLTDREKSVFYNFIKQLQNDSEAEYQFFKSHPELNP